MTQKLSSPVGRPDPAHEAWRRYYHYLRLERHGQPQPWHGGKGWTRVFAAGLVVLGIVAYGFHHRLTSPYAYSPWAPTITAPGTLPAQPSVLPEPIKPARP